MIFSADTVTTTLSSPLLGNAASRNHVARRGPRTAFPAFGFVKPRQTLILRPLLHRLAPSRCGKKGSFMRNRRHSSAWIPALGPLPSSAARPTLEVRESRERKISLRVLYFSLLAVIVA